jgi:paraquat-inducible protein A
VNADDPASNAWPTDDRTGRVCACRECDLLLRRAPGGTKCPRCGARVAPSQESSGESAFALYLAAAICFVIANRFPIIAIAAAGTETTVTLWGAARSIYSPQLAAVALLVMLTVIVIPGLDLLAAMALIGLARSHRHFDVIAWAARCREALHPWNMVEIFGLGALVAIVKLGSLARVILDTGLWALAGFMVLSAAAAHVFDPMSAWGGRRPRP